MSFNHISIRNYSHGDFKPILKLWESTKLANTERADTEEVIEKTIRAGGLFLLLTLRKTGEIIGTSWITNDQRRLSLHHFGIEPLYQGRGYATYLLEETLKQARKTGQQIKIEVHQTNLAALNLYKKYGFEYLGDYGVFIIRDIAEKP
ncbi:MAG: GNAT family N-acetyltransferase [Bacteroidales bacterium]|nr:GNAT family N-acetyltransferase [Bacteroidales bacterium]